MILYHGSNVIVQEPQILENGFYKDFGYGFYCTIIEKQAKRWALTKRRKHIVNFYEYSPWDYVEDYMAERISKEAFWELVKFKYPTHQIVFCTEKALQTIKFEGSYSL